MKQFKSPGQAQRFLSAYDQINDLFPFAAIASLLLSTEPPGTKCSRSGAKSPAWVGNKSQFPIPIA